MFKIFLVYYYWTHCVQTYTKRWKVQFVKMEVVPNNTNPCNNHKHITAGNMSKCWDLSQKPAFSHRNFFCCYVTFQHWFIIIIIIIIIFIFRLSNFVYIPRDVEMVKFSHIRKTYNVIQYNRAAFPKLFSSGDHFY
jgi:hypothetical protein